MDRSRGLSGSRQPVHGSLSRARQRPRNIARLSRGAQMADAVVKLVEPFLLSFSSSSAPVILCCPQLFHKLNIPQPLIEARLQAPYQLSTLFLSSKCPG